MTAYYYATLNGKTIARDSNLRKLCERILDLDSTRWAKIARRSGRSHAMLSSDEEKVVAEVRQRIADRREYRKAMATRVNDMAVGG